MRVPKEIVKAFLPEVEEYIATPLGSGLIHKTVSVMSEAGFHVFQRLNGCVFPDCGKMMQNIHRVTECLRRQEEPTLTFLTNSEDGSLLAHDFEGYAWRCSLHMPDTVTYDVPPSPRHLRSAARAFARFARCLSETEGLHLHPTIADFHHTPRRLEALEEAWRGARSERRSLPDYYALRHAATSFPEFGLDGLLPPHVPHSVAHNDTKLNNCLFRRDGEEAVCVIDLDTVMEGSWLMDFGDLCRTAICAAPEDTPNLDEIEIDLDRFGALVAGYAEVLGNAITPAERQRMVYSVFLLTYELALRFFTDYLSDDCYFGAAYPEHNLVRTRAQLTLALKVAATREAMERIVEEAFSSAREPVLER